MNLFFNRALRVLLATNGLILLAGAMLAPIYALYVEDIGGNLMDASLTGGIFALAAGTTCILSGRYADKRQRKEFVIVLGSMVMSFGFLLMTIVNSITTLFVVQALIGIGQAIYYPPYDALYSKHVDGHGAATAWGTWESMDYFSTAIGAILGGYIVTNWGFIPLFVIMSILCMISGLYLYYLPKKVLS